MGLQYSTSLRTAQAAAIATILGASASIKLFSGALPVNVAASDPSGTIATLLLDNPPFTSSSGTATLAGNPSDPADAAGVIRCFRAYDGSSACHIQGYVSEDWATSKEYVLNQQVNHGGNIYVCVTAGTSASSGGPSGTGTGITDGTAVWDYVAATSGLIINSTVASVGQPIAIASYAIVVQNS